MRALVVLWSLLAWPSLAHAQDRVIGLVELPEVFVNGPCDRFSPRDVTLHAAPGGDIVGVIRVATYWTFHSDVSCEGLEVAVRQRGSSTEEPLPQREYAYEAPAAVVLEQRDGWLKLRLANDAAWIRPSNPSAFHSLEALYEDGLTFLTSDWTRQLADAPNSPARAASVRADMREPSVRVLRSLRLNGTLWFQIEVLSHSECEDEPRVLDSGWVAAHSGSGEPSIWFASRGC